MISMTPFVQESAGQIIERFQREAPVDVMGIAEALGLQVWEDDINPYSGKLTKDADHGGFSGYSLIVNAGEPLARMRFTIAHEIAHFILHGSELLKGDIAETLYRGGLSDKLEIEANKLAADILMPLTLIEQLMAQGVTSLEALAASLEVSKTAIGIRLGASYVD